MSSEKLASGSSQLKGNLGGGWNLLSGSSGEYTDLGIARKFGGAAAAYSLRDIGAMNSRVVKVRRPRDNATDDFSASAIESGGVEQFVIGQDILDLYNNAAHFPGGSTNNYFNTSITLSGAFTISFDVVFTADAFHTNDTRIFQDTNGDDLLTFTKANECKFRVASGVRVFSALSTPLELYRKYSMIFARDGSGNYTLTIDGAAVATKTSSDTDDFTINRIGFRTTGALLNININSGEHIFAGDGADNSNWLDTGSGTAANATKVGTVNAFTGQNINGFVDTWYDQSGNGKNATQTSASLQPLIISDGAFTGVFMQEIVGGSEPNARNLVIDDIQTTDLGNNFGLIWVGKVDDAYTTTQLATLIGANRNVPTLNQGTIGLNVTLSSDSFSLNNETSGSATVNSGAPTISYTPGDRISVAGTCVGPDGDGDHTLKAYANNATPVSNNDTLVLTDSADDLRIMASNFGNTVRRDRSAIGKVDEVIIFDSDIESDIADIRQEINNYYTIY